jgi:transposase
MQYVLVDRTSDRPLVRFIRRRPLTVLRLNSWGYLLVVAGGRRGYAGGMRYPDGGGLTAAERERRETVRMAAAADFAAGASTAQAAARYRVSRMSAWRWHRDFEAGGREALRSKGPASRCRLDERELGLLQELLKAGPAAHGWADQRWILGRVRALVAEHFGVDYTLRGVSLVLHRLGWSVQVPAHQAAERDEAAIRVWRQDDWPAVKGPRATWAPGSSSRTKPVRGSGRPEHVPGVHAGTHR